MHKTLERSIGTGFGRWSGLLGNATGQGRRVWRRDVGPMSRYCKSSIAAVSPPSPAPETLLEPSVGFLTGVSARGHPSKVSKHRHGEDAYFIGNEHNIFGVADGISMWSDVNVDAGEYARCLMKHCHDEAVKMAESEGIVRPKTVLEKGYKLSLSTIGSSTACIVSLDEDGTLHAANIGDSVFLVIRSGICRETPYTPPKSFFGLGGGQQQQQMETEWNLVYRSHEMQKFFNCPDQLGPGCPDKPARSEVFELPVHPGDLVITASDGMSDNLSDNDICLLVKKHAKRLSNAFYEDGGFHSASEKHSEELNAWLESLSQILVDESHTVGMSETARTPFGKQCSRAGYHYEGGKLDDVVVVVGMVVTK